MSAPRLSVLEDIIDRAGAAARIEGMLPAGVRARQLSVRTLLAGMCLTQAGHRPAHLTRVHQALTTLGEDDQRRLGVIADWKHGPHRLTYRQTEYTFGLAARALAKDEPDGLPPAALARICDDLLEASIPDQFKDASTSLAVDWTDLESFSRPPPARGGNCADPEASWGHRRNNRPGDRDELFFGYYFSAGVMMPDENGPAVPELARRATVSSCRHDPVRALVPVLAAMPAAGIPLGDVLADSGYAHRDADAWALPLRAAGAQLVQDLHPHDRGPRGTHHGAIISNGNLYCPKAPRTLLELGPLARDATPDEAAAHDAKTAETALWRTASSAGSPPTTPTATTASPAQRSRARSAAPSGRRQCSSTAAGPRSSSHQNTRPPAAPSRRSPSRRTCSPRPRRNTTTPPPRTAAPTPAAPAPNAASPPPKTPPPTTSAAAGAASRAWRP